MGADDNNGMVDLISETVTGPVSGSVVVEALGLIVCIIVFQKAHGRLSLAHLVGKDLHTESDQIEILGEKDSSVYGCQLGDEIGI